MGLTLSWAEALGEFTGLDGVVAILTDAELAVFGAGPAKEPIAVEVYFIPAVLGGFGVDVEVGIITIVPLSHKTGVGAASNKIALRIPKTIAIGVE